MSLCFVLLGGYRHLAVEKALARRSYLGLSRGTGIAVSVYMTALVAATAWVMFWGPGAFERERFRCARLHLHAQDSPAATWTTRDTVLAAVELIHPLD